MGRAPCCEKMGLKKGPWTPQEDQILISYINLYGHGNWRALPKQAGLLRCGKSCRLRWTNYLRPDIKRGNFSREEEEAIINLHEMLGNRWSAIAAKLPGRTDNEIKNVWHTHLKKRLIMIKPPPNSHALIPKIKRKSTMKKEEADEHVLKEDEHMTNNETLGHVRSTTSISSWSPNNSTVENSPGRQQECSSGDDDVSSSSLAGLVDENFWSEVILMSGDDDNDCDDFFLAPVNVDSQINHHHHQEGDHNMDFWYNLFTGAEDFITHFPQL